MAMRKKVALVTGANRGIGFEAARQLARSGFEVILTSRDVRKGEAAAARLRDEKLDVVFHPLDVTSEESVRTAVAFTRERFGRLDVLVNNAGVLLDSGWDDGDPAKISAFNARLDTLRNTLEVNTLGAFRMIQECVPLMVKNGYGRVINVSSGMGQLSEMSSGYPGYRISKAALNAVTRIFASELRGSNILVNSVSPGWVRTDMGGEEADRSPEEGVRGILHLAQLPDGGPTGKFFRDQDVLDW